MACWNGALNVSVRAEIIKTNTLDGEQAVVYDHQRGSGMIVIPMKNEAVKQAYLHFCGLRLSDIIGLKWKDVFVDRGGAVSFGGIHAKDQRTDLSAAFSRSIEVDAGAWRQVAEGPVFDLPTQPVINVHLRPWAKAAGIDKRFSFHQSRHTFATMMLTLGADLYTTLKLLGHADVKMTRCTPKSSTGKRTMRSIWGTDCSTDP